MVLIVVLSGYRCCGVGEHGHRCGVDHHDDEYDLSSFVGSKSWLLFNKLVVPKSIEKCHELFVMLHFMN